MSLTPRLRRRLRVDFGDEAEVWGAALVALPTLATGSPGEAPERLRAAVLLGARGSRDEFRILYRLALTDWRDALVAGGVQHADWPEVLDRELGRPRRGLAGLLGLDR